MAIEIDMAIVLWCPVEDSKTIILTEIDMAIVLWCPVEDSKTIPLTLKLTWLLSCGVQLKI